MEKIPDQGQEGGNPLDRCPTCGRRITDFDPGGCELPSGQRACLEHLTRGQRAELEDAGAEFERCPVCGGPGPVGSVEHARCTRTGYEGL